MDASGAGSGAGAPGEVILFGDEVEIDFNPKTGHLWCLRGVAAEIQTSGSDQKRYLSGPLNMDTGYFLFVEGRTKRSELFIALLEKICYWPRRARRIHLLVDNHAIHESRATCAALENIRGRIVVHFLPEYSPEYNPVEPVWR